MTREQDQGGRLVDWLRTAKVFGPDLRLPFEAEVLAHLIGARIVSHSDAELAELSEDALEALPIILRREEHPVFEVTYCTRWEQTAFARERRIARACVRWLLDRYNEHHPKKPIPASDGVIDYLGVCLCDVRQASRADRSMTPEETQWQRKMLEKIDHLREHVYRGLVHRDDTRALLHDLDRGLNSWPQQGWPP